MFGIDGPEFIVILIVLIVVVGPKDLPKMLKAIGKATARMRTTANEFRRQFDEAMHEAELDDLQKTLTDVKDLDPRKKLTEIFDPIRDVAKDVKASIDGHQDAETSSINDQSSEQSDNKSSGEANSASDKSNSQAVTSNRETVSSVRIVDDEKFQSATVPTASAGGNSMATEEHPATQTSPEVKEAKPTAGKSANGNITEKQSTTSKPKTTAKRKVSATAKPSSSKKANISGAMKAPAQKQKTAKQAASRPKKATVADV
ncbi:Sec-independent protein translocase protein TatB [Bartonella apihabitans]|uniref:Sec-independent protein translocase protein TatB n=1 Tax=Bartonella apihabitans TaxID=2750929 RepID=UPI003997BEC1